MGPDLIQHTCIGQDENSPASIPRHVKSGDGRGSCPDDQTLISNLPYGDNLKVKPVITRGIFRR